jgi:hypothetical protein
MPYQVAVFLHTIGDDALQVYNGFSFESTAEDRTVSEIICAFDRFAIGDVNETNQRYLFHQRLSRVF